MRHGETPWNHDGLTMGQTDIDLSDVGRAQATAVASKLTEYGIDQIVCSPMQRTLSTIEPFRKICDCDFVIDTSWAERAWGIFEGRPKLDRGEETSPEGGETNKQFADRVSRAVTDLSENKTVLVVSHSGVFRQLCSLGFVAREALGTPAHATPIILQNVLDRRQAPFSR